MHRSVAKRSREEEKQHQHQLLQNSLVENITKTPRLSDSPFRMLQIVDNRLEKQTEHMQKQIRELLLESETRLLGEIDKRLNEMRVDMSNICERVSMLETLNKEIVDDKLSEIKRDITNVTERIQKIETNIDTSNEVTKSEEFQSELAKLRLKVMQQENSSVSCDLRINGIPYYSNENLFNMFDFLCQKLNIATPNISTIYRLNYKNKSPAPTILVKLMCPYDKNFILKTISMYRRNNKDLLRLSLLNYDSNEPFYVNENLSSSNYKIFNEALKLRKQKLLSAVFTLRGIVYVKEKEDDKPSAVNNAEKLKMFFRDDQDELFMQDA